MEQVQPDGREVSFILAQRVARLSTVAASGEPFVIPVCYAWDGERFYIPIDEKPKRRDRKLKRVRNIEETGHVALILDHYDDEDWSRLAWVLVRGSARMLAPGEERHGTAVSLLRERYRQYQSMKLEDAAIIAIIPSRITSWGALEPL